MLLDLVLKWEDGKGKDISNFSCIAANLVSLLGTKIIFLEKVYNHHILSDLQE